MNIASNNKPLLLLFGATGVGKTQFLVDHLVSKAEVVSADSIQVYKGLDIGSAKPSVTERKLIPHHLIDICSPDEPFDVGSFVSLAQASIKNISERGLLPVVSGGTAFYFYNFLFGLPQTPVSSPEIRKQVEALFRQNGPEEFHKMLEKIDPESAERIEKNDQYRQKRAYEVWLQTGRPLTSFRLVPQMRQDYKILILMAERSRDELALRINNRVDQMIKAGLIEEIQGLLKAGYNQDSPGLKGIGYAEFLPYLIQHKGSLSQAVEEVKNHSRQYAKRQRTFFKKIPQIHSFHPEDSKSVEPLLFELTH